MATLQIFIAVILVLATTKDGVLSCTLPSHKSGSLPCTTSDSDSTSFPHHAPVPCGSSLSKHRDTLNKNASNSPDSTSLQHHKLVSRPHTIPSVSPCDSLSGSSACLPKVLPSLPKGSILFKPLFIPAMSLPASTSVSPSTPVVPSGYNPALLKFLVKLCLSSSACNNSSKPQFTSESQTVLPTSSFTPVPVRIPQPHTISSSCASLPGSNSGSSNVLPSMSCGPTITAPVLQPPVTVPPSTSDVSSDLKNLVLLLSSLAPVSPLLPACKPTPLQPLCPSIRPTLNKDSVLSPVSKPHTTSHSSFPTLGLSSCSPSTSPGFPCRSFLPPKITVLKSDSESVQTQITKGIPDHVPEEFPVSVAGSVQPPALESTLPTQPTLPSAGHNPTTINNLVHLLLTPKLNITSVSIPNHTPHVLFPPCATPPGSNSCLSSSEPNLSNNLNLPINLTSVKHPLLPFSVPSVPMLSPGISSGYNPAYMYHLIKYLLSTSNYTPPLSSSIPVSQSLINVTLVSPPSQNSLSISNYSNEQSSDLKPSVSLSNKSSDSTLTSTISPNISNTQNILRLPNAPNILNISVNNNNNNNNPFLTHLLCKLLLSSLIASKTSFHPCLPSQSSQSVFSLNTNPTLSIVPNRLPSSLPFQSTIASLPDLLSIFPNILSGSNLSSPGVPSFPLTPLPITKPLLEPIQSTIPDALTPAPLLSPLLGCHHKHLRPHQTGVNPCVRKAIRSNTPSPMLPCSLSSSKLNSGCKFGT